MRKRTRAEPRANGWVDHLITFGLALALAAALILAITSAILGGSREFMYLQF